MRRTAPPPFNFNATVAQSGHPEMIALFKQIPNQKDNGVGIVQRVYEQKKQEARAAHGAAGACPALSSMVQTVIHQKRLALRDISALCGVTYADSITLSKKLAGTNYSYESPDR